jgi:hypothetical protein
MGISLSALASAASHSSGDGGGLSTAAVVLIVLAGALLVGCAVWGVARARAWEPRWASALRHAFAEAGLRAAAAWREFGDWARLGR